MRVRLLARNEAKASEVQSVNIIFHLYHAVIYSCCRLDSNWCPIETLNGASNVNANSFLLLEFRVSAGCTIVAPLSKLPPSLLRPSSRSSLHASSLFSTLPFIPQKQLFFCSVPSIRSQHSSSTSHQRVVFASSTPPSNTSTVAAPRQNSSRFFTPRLTQVCNSRYPSTPQRLRLSRLASALCSPSCVPQPLPHFHPSLPL